MQNIIVPKPYRFIPPHRGDLVPSLVQKLRILDAYLGRAEGITSFEVRGIEHLRESLRLRRGILLAPNHCRYADPLAMGWVARQAHVHVFAMASWHLFHEHWLQAFAMRMCGGFSVYREGMDRQSLDTAIQILVDGKRPLVLFPEGAVYRANDQLQPMLDGVSFLARTAARRRAGRDHGQVVIHPVGIKYTFRGDALASALPIIARIESRFTWKSTHAADRETSPAVVVARVRRLEEGLLALKEVQYLGKVQTGTAASRRTALIEGLLGEVERRWLSPPQVEKGPPRGLLNRIKPLRVKMVPFLIAHCAQQPGKRRERTSGLMSEPVGPVAAATIRGAQDGLPACLASLSRGELIPIIWSDLERLYVAQQIASYPPGYLDNPTDMRVLETVERIEEDIFDRSTIHRPLHAILQVEQAMTVPTDRPPRDGIDPLMEELAQRLTARLSELSTAARPIGSPAIGSPAIGSPPLEIPSASSRQSRSQ